MSAASLILAFLLSGQLVADRYDTPGTTQDGGTVEAIGNPFETDAEPITPLQGPGAAQDSGNPQQPITPADDPSPPFGPNSQPGALDSQYSTPADSAPPPSQSDQGAPYPPIGSGNPERPATLGVYPSQPAGDRAGLPDDNLGAPLSDKKDSPTARMRAILEPPPQASLSGTPISLTQVVAMAGSRDYQSTCIDAYWDLGICVADYYLAIREQDEIRRIQEGMPSTATSAAWQEAGEQLAVRLRTSELAATAAQHRLASLLGRGMTLRQLPLPADVPHCGDYDTRYEQNFAGRPHPEAQELAALLPLRYEQLKVAAAGVSLEEERLAQLGMGLGADEQTLLQAAESLSLRRREFMQLAGDYNRRIARYTELATPGEIGSGRLVSMLISNPHSADSPASGGRFDDILDQQSRGAAPPQTFAEGWTPARTGDSPRRDRSVEQASAESQTQHREKSLLVSPRSLDR